MNLSGTIAGTMAGDAAHDRADDQASRLRSLVRALRDKEPGDPGDAPAPPPARAPQTGSAGADEVSMSREPARPRARVIAIASGKGGVGKSVLAVNLAISLARARRRVVLLDGDLGAANDDVLLNLRPVRRLSPTLSTPLAPLAIDAGHGLLLIPGPVGVRAGGIDPSALWCRLHELDAIADTIVVDLPAGIDPFVVETGAQADSLLVVTTPEPPAAGDAYALIKGVTHRRSEGRCTPRQSIELVVNQARDDASGRIVHERIALVAQRFLGRRLPLAGVIAFDAGVPRSVTTRAPLVVHDPSTPASGAITAIAARISDAALSGNGANAASSSGV